MSTSSKIKSLWRSSNPFLPLKPFLRELLEDATTSEEDKQLIQAWRSNKAGTPEKIAKDLRFKNKGAHIAILRQATKNARKSKKPGGGKATSTPPTP